MEKISLAEYEKKVVELAYENLKDCSWFRGTVCMDTIKDSYQSDKDIERAADIAEMDTEWWDR